MDFLESSVVLVPALTGMALTLYDGNQDTLKQFESQFCFSPQLQRIYTVKGLIALFKGGVEERIYDLEEEAGTRLAVFKVQGRWVLLGPYVEEGWSERKARQLLAKLGASEAALPMYKAYRCKLPIVRQEFALKTAFLLTENLGSDMQAVEYLRLDPEGRSSALAFSDRYDNAKEVNRRYQLEDAFIGAVSQGDAKEAHRIWKEIGKVMSDIRFLSDSMQDYLVGAAIRRTLIRIGGKQGGLSPVLIDSISQEYAQKMKNAGSKEAVSGLLAEMSGQICEQVQKQRRCRWSSVVQKAVDYMQVNLSKTMTTEEIARAAGEKKRDFARRFFQETGMTVKEYLAKIRCDIAAQLLASSDASVQEIAVYVGYLDNNYFSKVFKANLGMSPQTYRAVCKTSQM